MSNWYEDYLAAWNRRDADGVAAFFAEHTDFEDVGLAHRISSRAAMRASAVEMFTQMADMRLDYVGGSEFGDSYYHEWTMHPLSMRGVSVGRRTNGLVTYNRDYWRMPTAH
ncbi:MAG: nuclear transport factor 2 family protein [Actinomycetota bacterium]|nr:nuclear transport factor 2 family protein [Actinomycetota bacterium]